MWDDVDGLYYDLSTTGVKIKNVTVACFWPMLAGICSKVQFEKMVANLKDTATF